MKKFLLTIALCLLLTSIHLILIPNSVEAKGMTICSEKYSGNNAGVDKFKNKPSLKFSWCNIVYYDENPKLYDAISRKLRTTYRKDYHNYFIDKKLLERLYDQFPAKIEKNQTLTKSSQKLLEQEKKKLEAEKKKLQEERNKLAAEKKEQEEKQKKLALKKQKEEEEENRKIAEANEYKELVKKFRSDCESNWSNMFTGSKIGTPDFDQCLYEKKNEQIKLAKLENEKLELEKEIFMTLSIEEKRAFTCTKTFGFKKGSDKFKECIFKIYAAELELAKLEVEKQLAEAQLKIAEAQREAADARVLAAKSQGELQKAQIQATEAQAAAAQQQAAASKAQAAATQQQSSMSLLMQGLQMLQPPTQPQSLKTTCRWSGGFLNCW